MLNITDAKLLDGYRIALLFDDSHQQIVDFSPFLSSSHHPCIRAYLDPVLFERFELRHGELVWGVFDLCFPMVDLYNNNFLHDGEHLAVA